MKSLLLCMMILFVNVLFAQKGYKAGDTITSFDKLRLLDSINRYRALKDIPLLSYSFQEDSLARLRISTIYNHVDSIGEVEFRKNVIEHQHYNWEADWYSYDKKNVHPDTVLSYYAECTARLHKLVEVDDMVDNLFNGWKNSPEHWEAMMDSKYEYITFYWLNDSQYIESGKPLPLRRGYFGALVLFSKDRNQKTIKN
jgi:hypothetical protein